MLGSTLSVYKLIEELGSGGSGAVYLARDTRSGELVAVKVLKLEHSNRPDFRQLFEQEALKLRNLCQSRPHPHIVGLRNFGWYNDQQPYLVMDYLAGKDLGNLLEDGPLPVRQAISIAAQVAEALDFAARHELVHCDVKPENLKVQLDDDVTVKVMDFGIASMADSSFRERAGTPDYMAPEVWREPPPAPASARDVYALGCVLYEMLTGRPPFVSSIRGEDTRARHERQHEIRQMHQTVEPDWSLLSVEIIPEQVVAVLKAMLAKSPDDRPSAGWIVEQLRLMESEIPPDVRLPGVAATVGDEETQPHVPGESEGTVLRPESKPLTPPNDAVTTPPRLERISTGARIAVQRHLGTIDLGGEACRAGLVRDGVLFTGMLDGQVFRIDLRTGRTDRWTVVSRSAEHSPNWAFAGRSDRLVLHVGGSEWIELSVASGQVVRKGPLPEPGMSFVMAGDWLYLIGSGSHVYRAPLRDPDRRDDFDLGARSTGLLCVVPGAMFASTSGGIVRVDTGSRQTDAIGPAQIARSVSAMSSGCLVALYSSVDADSTQHSHVRLFDVSGSTGSLLAETEVVGQSAGPAQVAGDRIFLACRDGQVWAWDAAQSDGAWSLRPAWSCRVGSERRLHVAPSLGSGLLALVPCKDGDGVLVVLNATTGQTVFEHPIAGDVFVSPMWWEGIVSVILAAGSVEVFRASRDMRAPSA
jgi:serine/threonine protein kinase